MSDFQAIAAYQRTPEGWKFTERVDEVLYLDTTPLSGSLPPAARAATGLPTEHTLGEGPKGNHR